ncbi:MAG: hypothetical protein A2X87_04205 [Deltaproteobacteria bacterium GWC2_42_51]|nr:MAG: hypothetical protein A2056_00200 [Deltaproteobacteria bacterium GWA2_42_85]OGP37169.1 MAG: hypothetical protein A2X87_04205 [Deltaproteobacteria bacterium GWC2_42_51]OGP41591.1 MAG: hypothetical protein A2090_08180 [Deltaproteobacteria bacterium GWD2_42_10]OGP46732.1 MAG: hypothetical protein A2022_04665 [Deltaproteobacteria bacterium GWF2_42_12]OGQ23940.1 MAG: hypothetical protein A3D29_01775 [Deltaproteobacteria bacterium RIFCSPHIGHO2_02_FULL_42_44]OGQ36247.1 MAG: hypothetical protei
MEKFSEILFQPFRDFWQWFVKFAPNLMAMLIIIIAGLILAWLIRLVMLRILRVINFDTWSDKVGLTALIRKGDVWAKPSDFFGYAVYLLLAVVFVMIGLDALQIKVIDNLLSQFLLYLPRALSAILILIIGYIIAGFLSRGVLIAAVNSGYHHAKLIAEAVRLLFIILVLAMALVELTIARGIVIAAFSILFGGVVLALAIAFGVGGIDAAKRIIEKAREEKKEEKGRDIEHI